MAARTSIATRSVLKGALVHGLGMKAVMLALSFALLPLTTLQAGRLLGEVPQAAQSAADKGPQSTATNQQTDAAAEQKKREEAADRSKQMNVHMANGNKAMNEAREIRRRVDTATGDQRPALLAQMKADYETAVTEYKEALNHTKAAEEESVKSFGLIGVIRNGLISQDKAVQMITQDKNLPVILSNLGIAYSGIGDYDDAIPMLREAMLSNQEPETYMQLGTDLAEVGKVQEATATCDQIPNVRPTATDLQAACYKNVGIVLTNAGKLADAAVPLQKTTQLNPSDALAWKLLGDALSNAITTRQENGRIIYVVPAGTLAAYQKYLQLQPNGPYAAQVKAVLEGLEQLTKGASTSVETKNTP
jgi:tetratricopeptide (TPR) repeat protein